jgi:DNA polymerase III sliding clamp (beta) subunit (PCNA family)
MRITTNVKTFRDRLAIVGRVVPKRAPTFICSGVLLVWDDSADASAALRYAEATDTAMTIHCGTPGTGIRTVVDHELVSKTLAALPSTVKEIVIEIGEVMTISAGRVTASLPLMDAAEWPDARQVPSGMTRVPSAFLSRALATTLLSTATDTTRPALAGVHVVVDDDDVVLEASDGYRAHRASLTQAGDDIVGHRLDVIVPRAACGVLAALSVEQIGVESGVLCAMAGDVTMWTRTIHGVFPTLERVLQPSRESPNRCRIAGDALDALQSAVRLGQLYSAPQGASTIPSARFVLSAAGELLVTAKHDGRLVTVPIAVQDATGSGEARLNLAYVADALKACGGDVVLTMGEPTSAPHLSSTNMEAVIMPMTL